LQSKAIVRAGASFGVAGERGRLSRLLTVGIPAVAVLALSAWAGVWIARQAPAAAPQAAAPPRPFAAEVYGALFDPAFGSGVSADSPPILLADRFSAWSGAEPSLDLAPAAPAEAAGAQEAQDVAALAEAMSASRPPSHVAEAAIPVAPPAPLRRPETRPVVRLAVTRPAPLPKLFDTQAPAAALGYASAEDGDSSLARSDVAGPSARYDRWTAVYDVAAHTVYLPTGARLEAHSGLGGMKDDPRSVRAVNRGATPPDLYQLAPVEQLFHGVAALRLNPVGGVDPFGRTGLLAHTYMLGPHGDSNGCVVFKDYAAFLRAYQSGQIKRLAVVARLD
jgi:hypothetical protein